jgi:hypothetical protein
MFEKKGKGNQNFITLTTVPRSLCVYVQNKYKQCFTGRKFEFIVLSKRGGWQSGPDGRVPA